MKEFIQIIIEKLVDHEHVNVFFKEVNSVEELIALKEDFENTHMHITADTHMHITADTHMCKNIVITEYYNSDALFDGHEVCICYLADATDNEILSFCIKSLQI